MSFKCVFWSMVTFEDLNFVCLFISLCRVGKALLGKSTGAPSFYMMRMKQKMVVISVLSLKCVRKSNYLVMCAMKRLKRLWESTHSSFFTVLFFFGWGRGVGWEVFLVFFLIILVLPHSGWWISFLWFWRLPIIS